MHELTGKSGRHVLSDLLLNLEFSIVLVASSSTKVRVSR